MAATCAEETALLRAVIDDPTDDTVRLVYADWLDEHDRPVRARFIRLEVALRGARSFAVSDRRTVSAELGQLTARHPVTEYADIALEWARWQFTVSRGFVAEIAATVDDLETSDDLRAVFRAHPVVKCWLLHKWPETWPRVWLPNKYFSKSFWYFDEDNTFATVPRVNLLPACLAEDLACHPDCVAVDCGGVFFATSVIARRALAEAAATHLRRAERAAR